MVVAGGIDVMSRRIPNLLILVTALAFPPFAFAIGMPWWMAFEHGATATVLLILGFALFSLRFIGGGDAKLMAVAGLWLGLAPSVLFVAYTALAGGILAAAVGLWHILRVEAGLRSNTADALLGVLKPDVPYGYALATGAILAIPYSWLSPPPSM
jgi:prepilin peptidase CpaA